MVMPARLLTPTEHARVTAAVADAEARTAGEIATIVAARSDDYGDWALRWALAGPLLWIAALTMWPHLLERLVLRLSGGWLVDYSIVDILLTALIGQILLFGFALLLLRWPVLRLALTPRSVRSQRVRAAALRAFRTGTEARTQDATGVLIYLSLAEHRAEIVADAAIHGRVPADVWGAAMASLLTAVQDGRLADGICDAVNLVGGVLAEHFPGSHDDANEMPDRLIEL